MYSVSIFFSFLYSFLKLKKLKRWISIVKLNVEHFNVVSMLFNIVNINVEIGKVDSTLFNVINFNVDIHNVVSTLI